MASTAVLAVALAATLMVGVPALPALPAALASEPAVAAGTSAGPQVEYFVGNRPASAARAANAARTAARPPAPRKVDLNTASVEQLAALTGIGEVRARSIVRNRPYTRKDDLVRKKVLAKAAYDAIRDEIVARR